MIPSIIANKPFIKINAQEMADVTNEFARLNKKYALELLAAGYRADITAQDIIHANDRINAFAETGDLTKDGRKLLISTTRSIFGLNSKQVKQLTIGDYFKRVLEGLEAISNKSKDV